MLCPSLIYGLVSLADLIYNEVPPLVKIWTWIMWHGSNYFFVRPRLLSTLTVCITNSGHWSFHLITIIWSIILDWPNHTFYHVTLFIYHCVDAPLSPRAAIRHFPSNGLLVVHQIGVFISMCINFPPARCGIWYDGHYLDILSASANQKREEGGRERRHLPLIQPASHYQVQATKSEKLGTKRRKDKVDRKRKATSSTRVEE